MARLSILSKEVQELVEEKITPLFLAENSTARLCKALNASLSQSSIEGVIHANRLHALLSDDVSRGINDGTFALIQKAAQAYCTANSEWEAKTERRTSELKTEIEHLRQTRSLPDKDIVQRLGLPPAVGRKILTLCSPDTSTDVSPAPQSPAIKQHSAPDWDFQDKAISRCLETFRQKPTAKIGLILPTGAGKTRTALRIILEVLARSEDKSGVIYWVTHLKNLRTQAHRELQKLLSTGGDQIPEDAAKLLAKRIRFVMVSEISTIYADNQPTPILIVVDEAHHAAAPSYKSIFEDGASVPALFLTATPNRTDNLPIGIDEIVFTITYRELEERGVVIMPQFLEFPVQDFEWSEAQIKDLADYIIDEAGGRFTKALVLAPRIDRVEEFHEALIKALEMETGHPLDLEDIGFIHGSGNSLYTNNDDFLDIFSKKPRSILVSAQLLLEGFDDPTIDTVVLTYPSTSLVRLMQASGRCVRYAPGKTSSYVIQARNDNLAYHFDQRWLYQEISDYLRPKLIDIEYTSKEDLNAKVSALLQQHNVKPAAQERILARLPEIAPGELCRILFSGFPYYGAPESFDQDGEWGAFLETGQNSVAFRGVFNAFSDIGAGLSDPSDFLSREAGRYGVAKDISQGSPWRELMRILTSAYFARQEIYNGDPLARASRPTKKHGPTTWLTYATFHYRPAMPSELDEFLSDCYNRTQLATEFLDNQDKYTLAVKFPLPLGDYEGWLLSQESAQAFDECISAAQARLKEVAPIAQVGELSAFIAIAEFPLLPSRLLMRIEGFLNPSFHSNRVLSLAPNQPTTTTGE